MADTRLSRREEHIDRGKVLRPNLAVDAPQRTARHFVKNRPSSALWSRAVFLSKLTINVA